MRPHRADRLQTAAWATCGLALAGLFWLLSPILTPFVIGAVFAYICAPTVSWMVAHRLPRSVAVLLMILALGLGLVALTLILVPLVYGETITLLRRLPELVELLNTELTPLLKTHFGIRLKLDSGQLRKLMTENWDTAQDVLPILFGHLKSGGLVLLGFIANLFLIPVVMFYLLQEWPRLLDELHRVVPRPWLPRTLRITGAIDSVLSEFLRGQLSVMMLLAIYYSVGLWFAGLNFALPVGVLTGLLVFIPYIGFGGGLLLAIFAALLQAEGWPPLIGVAIVFGIGQLIESFVLTPYLVGERIGLHPLAVIFALMAFGQLFGFTGILVGLPVSAALLVSLREVRTAWFSSHLYLGASPPPPRGQDGS